MNLTSDHHVDQSRSPIIEMSDIVKSFRHRRVLDGISLMVLQSEFVAISGSSGSGKSTLLNIIGLLDKADQGNITLFGKPAPALNSPRARHFLRTKIGYLFQNAALIDQDTVEDNLKTTQRYSLTTLAQRPVERHIALHEVGLDGMEKRRVYELSGGEQQRLAVACLLVQTNDLILADEPTGSLDSGNRDLVLSLLHKLNQQGRTIIVVTHDPHIAAAADRTIGLD
jgi:putative ABC transport system ATP-binding protein